MRCPLLPSIEGKIFEDTGRIFGAWFSAVHFLCVSCCLSCNVTEATCRLKVMLIFLECLSRTTAFTESMEECVRAGPCNIH